MPSPFPRSIRSLDADRFHSSGTSIAIAMIILTAWMCWFLFASIARYEVTDSARLEVDRTAHALQVPVAGRVASSRLWLGEQIEAGQVLVELESESQRLQLSEERSRLNTVASRLTVLRAELKTERQASAKEQQVLPPTLDEARSKFREAEALAQMSQEEADRAGRLRDAGVLSESEFRRAQAEAQSRLAAAESLRVSVRRIESEKRVREKEREAHLEELEGEFSRLQGEEQTSAATIERLKYEIERRLVRAPITGRLGEVANIRIGSVVAEGEKLGLIVPSGTIRAVADFLPSAALGRIRPEQHAILRLYGFPWAQYGTITARVSTVGNEVRNDQVRVEFLLDPNPHSLIPLQHGIPGSIEVEVERVSPATLVLRAAGKLIAVAKDASPAPKGQRELN